MTECKLIQFEELVLFETDLKLTTYPAFTPHFSENYLYCRFTYVRV